MGTHNRYVTEFGAGGERYVLTMRQLGALRHFGWIVAGFGLIGDGEGRDLRQYSELGCAIVAERGAGKDFLEQ